jgi:hypothetical protein
MTIARITSARGYMENKIFFVFKANLHILFKIFYFIIVSVIFFEYISRPQDAGISRQLVTLTHLFFIGFPLTLFVDFYIFAPLALLDYMFGLKDIYPSRGFDNCILLLIGFINVAAGYHQWFTIIPNIISRTYAKAMRTDGLRSSWRR